MIEYNTLREVRDMLYMSPATAREITAALFEPSKAAKRTVDFAVIQSKLRKLERTGEATQNQFGVYSLTGLGRKTAVSYVSNK